MWNKIRLFTDFKNEKGEGFMKVIKKLLSLVLVLIIMMIMLPVTNLFADGEDEYAPVPLIEVRKSVNKSEFLAVDEKIIYTYTVTNIGGVTLNGSLSPTFAAPFTLEDDKIGILDTSSESYLLEPDERFTVTAEYKITQADMDAGFVTNIVKVMGVSLDGEYVEDTDSLTIRFKKKQPVEPTKPVELTIVDKLNMEDHFQYIQGYPDNTVRPEGLITREEVAMVFFRLLTSQYRDSIRTSSHTFQDVKAGRWSEEPIATLSKANIVQGYEDGTFRPGNNITRAELATIASRFDKLSPITNSKFSDIENHWAKEFINSASEKGWVNGYEDGTFRPNKYMTRAEFVSLVNNVLKRELE